MTDAHPMRQFYNTWKTLFDSQSFRIIPSHRVPDRADLIKNVVNPFTWSPVRLGSVRSIGFETTDNGEIILSLAHRNAARELVIFPDGDFMFEPYWPASINALSRNTPFVLQYSGGAYVSFDTVQNMWYLARDVETDRAHYRKPILGAYSMRRLRYDTRNPEEWVYRLEPKRFHRPQIGKFSVWALTTTPRNSDEDNERLQRFIDREHELALRRWPGEREPKPVTISVGGKAVTGDAAVAHITQDITPTVYSRPPRLVDGLVTPSGIRERARKGQHDQVD